MFYCEICSEWMNCWNDCENCDIWKEEYGEEELWKIKKYARLNLPCWVVVIAKNKIALGGVSGPTVAPW